MSTLKTFELAVIISLTTGVLYMGTKQEDVDAVVEHVNGAPVAEEDYADALDRAVTHLVDNYPKIADATRVMSNSRTLDAARYNKLIDLYRKNHQIDTGVAVEA